MLYQCSQHFNRFYTQQCCKLISPGIHRVTAYKFQTRRFVCGRLYTSWRNMYTYYTYLLSSGRPPTYFANVSAHGTLIFPICNFPQKSSRWLRATTTAFSTSQNSTMPDSLSEVCQWLANACTAQHCSHFFMYVHLKLQV